MEEGEISDNIKFIIKKFEGYILKNKISLLFYAVLYFFLLYLIINFTQEIINSRLITFIISMYFKDKLATASIFIGLVGALILILGHISSDNEEKISEREGKLLSGAAFLQNKIANAGGLILLVLFYIAYYKIFNWIEFGIFFLLYFVIFGIIGLHFMIHLNQIYDWDTIENKADKISLNIYLGGMAFQIGLLFYIYSLQYVTTIIFNVLNIWILFFGLMFSASFKYSRTKKIVVKYFDNKEEYAHLVRIENGFARLITKNCGSKQINLSEIKEMNYDTKYIENFRKNVSSANDCD